MKLLTFGVSAPATIGATMPGTVATVLVIPYKTPAYLNKGLEKTPENYRFNCSIASNVKTNQRRKVLRSRNTMYL